MQKIIYLSSLILGTITLITTSVIVFSIIGKVDENSGNAGAFAGFISLGIISISIILVGACGVVGSATSYIYKDKLPNTLRYKIYWPLALTIPAIVLLLYFAWSLTLNKNF